MGTGEATIAVHAWCAVTKFISLVTTRSVETPGSTHELVFAHAVYNGSMYRIAEKIRGIKFHDFALGQTFLRY